MEWISVKDRLPEAQEKVLVYSNVYGVKIALYIGLAMWRVYDLDRPDYPPTHWCSIPNRPAYA